MKQVVDQEIILAFHRHERLVCVVNQRINIQTITHEEAVKFEETLQESRNSIIQMILSKKT